MIMQFLILGVAFATISAAPEWDYKDTSQWCNDFPICCSTSPRQSPIDVVTTNAVPQSYPDLTFTITSGDSAAVPGTAANNGHTIGWAIDSGSTVTIEGGPLGSDTYQLAQFHFHWGRTQKTGAEHALNGIFYPAEVHLVHFNTKYGLLGNALDKTDGLAVIGMFMEVEEANSVVFEPIIKVFQQLRKPEAMTPTVNMDLSMLYSLVNLNRFTTYLGSLTTPPCFESVTWINVLDPIKIGRKDLKFMRLVRETNDKTRLVNNYRALQNNQQPLYINTNI